MSKDTPTKIIVIHIKDEFNLVINAGKNYEIKKGQRFLVYSLGEELFDPETKESLGRFEDVKGTGKVIHVQDKMATLQSDMKEAATRRVVTTKPPVLLSTSVWLTNSTETEEYVPPDSKPFEDPELGDYVKKI